MLEVKPARVDRSDYISQTVWDFPYCANEKMFFRRFVQLFFRCCIFFVAGKYRLCTQRWKTYA